MTIGDDVAGGVDNKARAQRHRFAPGLRRPAILKKTLQQLVERRRGLVAVLGGLLGLCFAYWLTTMTEKAWPLPTGGMPIVAMWPNLIIMFELTMLGGILATVITLLIVTSLLRRQPTLYDTEVSDSEILVGVQNPPAASRETVERALLARGGRLKMID